MRKMFSFLCRSSRGRLRMHANSTPTEYCTRFQGWNQSTKIDNA